jgi:type IV pilus assembly protein PilX
MADRALRQASPNQSGVVLITGLIFMVILTMIVLAVLRSGSLEERMAANARNRQLAMQAAEAVLRDAEETLFTDPMPAPFDPYTPGSFSEVCTGGYCRPAAAGGTPRWQEIDWSDAVSRTFASDASNLTPALVASQPRYIVEPIDPPHRTSTENETCTQGLYRVTARGVGPDGSEVFVEATYRAPVMENNAC